MIDKIECLARDNKRLMKIEVAAKSLLDDVRRRHPGEELHCPNMRALDDALKS